MVVVAAWAAQDLSCVTGEAQQDTAVCSVSPWTSTVCLCVQ